MSGPRNCEPVFMDAVADVLEPYYGKTPRVLVPLWWVIVPLYVAACFVETAGRWLFDPDTRK